MVVGDIVGVLGFGVLAFAVLGTEFLAQPRCVRLTARGERGGLRHNRLKRGIDGVTAFCCIGSAA